MSADLTLNEIKKEWHGNLRSYLIGFIASFLLTSTSFFLVATDAFSKKTLIYTICGLAFTQAIFQLLFFLHLGKEPKPRWETYIFFFMAFILFIIVIGSLWVMNDLNHRVMPMMDNISQEMMHD